MTTILPSSWMHGISDSAPITELSIPGTHDSGATHELIIGLLKCQNLGIPEQLTSGIRFLDIRCRHYQNDLFIHHDRLYEGITFADVLRTCTSFLKQFPSETIFMSVKQETSDLWVNQPQGNTRTFRDTFSEVVKATAGAAFYNYVPQSSGQSPANKPEISAATTLKDVRGKIVLLRRFAGDPLGYDGLSVEQWSDDACFTVAGTGNRYVNGVATAVTLTCKIEDRYDDPDRKTGVGGTKFTYVKDHLTAAETGNEQELYITFSSAVAQQASGYSKSVNPSLDALLAQKSKSRLGIIAMDYFEAPGSLVENLIKTNPHLTDVWSTATALRNQGLLDTPVYFQPERAESPPTFWEIEDSSTNSGSPIQLWAGKTANRKWQIQAHGTVGGNETFVLYNAHLKQWLSFASATQGTKARSTTSAASAQAFLIRQSGAALSFHIPQKATLCIECENGNLGNSTKLQLWDIGSMNAREQYRTHWVPAKT